MDEKTKAFYDEFWPKNVPHYEETKKYMLSTITERHVGKSLDAGCGHGLCSVVLSELSDIVVGVDLSQACITTAQSMAQKYGRTNISFMQQDLQHLDLPNASFDLVWCWGVAMMAPKPDLVFDNIFRVVKPGGTVYCGVYLKTWLSPVHQFLRHFFRTFFPSGKRKQFILDFFAWLTDVIVKVRGTAINLRPDNISTQVQVDDWFYPPFKTFYSPMQIIDKMKKHGIDGSIIQSQAGRMKSATIFVVRGAKKGLSQP
jgi:ubiquinone/menaquinone biosynthesis C-methylase UbiE